MKNSSKSENIFLKKGFIIERVENLKSLSYINNLIKKNLVKILRLNISINKLNLNKLHLFIREKNLNKTRLDLINSINNDKKLRKNYFSLAERMLENIVGNELGETSRKEKYTR